MSTPSIPYRFQSANTQSFAISTPGDKVGQEVGVKRGNPEESILFTNRPIGEDPVVVEITGVAPKRLRVSYKGDGTKLTWSDKVHMWVVRKTHKGTYVITPVGGEETFWVNESNVEVIEIRLGEDVKPPQNEWFIIPA